MVALDKPPRDDKGCFEKAKDRDREAVSARIYVLEARMREPYEKKVRRARALVKEAIDRFGDRTAVSCSFGKDSTLVLYLARELNPDVKVIFCNTGVEYPETIQFRDRLTKEWDLNLLEAQSDKTFWQIVKEEKERTGTHGYPDIRFRRREPACCRILKIAPLRKLIRDHDIKATITGLSAAESYQRKWVFIWYGDHYEMHKGMPWPIWKYHPVGYWTMEEVWRFTREEELPVNKAYEKLDRVGCMPCTAFLGWQEKLGRTNLPLLKKISKDRGSPILEVFDGA